jgi:signal transduction histidine kinase
MKAPNPRLERRLIVWLSAVFAGSLLLFTAALAAVAYREFAAGVGEDGEANAGAWLWSEITTEVLPMLLPLLVFTLVVVVIAGGYVMVRAVSRELAVAQLQSDFVSAVSHEFRTPLTSLQQFTDLLSDDPEQPASKRRTYYQAQARAAERLRRLVESLLDFGRMEAGARPYRLERLAVAPLVARIVEDFTREGAPHAFVIEASISDEGRAFDVDPDAFTRALWNLLENAVKYSGSSRTVTVTLEPRNDTVVIGVRDRGLGIPRHEHHEIFKKFVRGAASREHGIKGTGIGLAMVRHIVDAHGGAVSVESAPGEGSTFTIALPAAPLPDSVVAAPHARADDGGEPRCLAS